MTATVTSGGTPRPTTAALAAPIACGACLVAGTAYVVANDPSDGGTFLPCPFRALTGWWCPGCGVTRAIHHLFRGEIVQALRFNLFVIVILAALVATWSAWTAHAAGKNVTRIVTCIPVWLQVAAGAALLVFAVVRNATDLPLTG